MNYFLPKTPYKNCQILPYGSVTRGTNTIYSDFDVLVICNEALFNMERDAIHDFLVDNGFYKFIRTKYLNNDTTIRIDITLATNETPCEILGNSYFSYVIYNDLGKRTIIYPDYIHTSFMNIYNQFGSDLIEFVRKEKIKAHKEKVIAPSIFIELDAIKKYTNVTLQLF